VDIKLLEDFLCLARLQNFSRAADERFVSQPAFSRRIKSLEIWVGSPLVDRNTYPIQLTSAGLAFRNVAESILRQLYQGKADINRMGWSGDDPITIIAAQSLALHFFPKWLKDVEENYQPTEFSLMPDSLYNGMEALIGGQVDFLLVYSHPSSPVLIDETRYPYQIVGFENYYPVSAVTDGKPKFMLTRLEGQQIPYLAYTENEFLHKVLVSILQNLSQSVDLKQLMENPMANGLKALALHGFGVAWLPESIMGDELNNNVLVRIGESEFSTKLEIRLYRGEIERKSAALKMWNAFINH
jgi:LysR family transcriptional regulator, hypochlorite-specific transcription factor HypT